MAGELQSECFLRHGAGGTVARRLFLSGLSGGSCNRLDKGRGFPLEFWEIHPPPSRPAMTELLVYAPGLRLEERIMQLGHQMDILAARYKVDANHDMVYFEIDDPTKISLRQVSELFESIGLQPRFVGQVPSELRSGDVTDRLVP